jgi:hypothetical protein
MSISSLVSSLGSVQASSQAYAQSLAGGNVTASNVVGLSQNQTTYAAVIKSIKIDDDMQKDVLNIINPHLGNNVNTTA